MLIFSARRLSHGDGIHDDTAALQEMLDGQGIVTVDRPGTYLISKTLMIHSNTRFILSPGAVLLAAPMSKCALIENEHFAGNGRDENITVTGGTWDGNCDAKPIPLRVHSSPFLPRLRSSGS